MKEINIPTTQFVNLISVVGIMKMNAENGAERKIY